MRRKEKEKGGHGEKRKKKILKEGSNEGINEGRNEKRPKKTREGTAKREREKDKGGNDGKKDHVDWTIFYCALRRKDRNVKTNMSTAQ